MSKSGSHFKEHISLEINSKKRTRGTIEDPTFHIDHQIKFSNKNSKSYWIRLENIQIPRSFYMINSSNNVFRVLEDDGAAGDDVISITIDPGNYDITELITELESQLDANTANANAYTLTYDDITNKMSLLFTGATSADITVDSISNGSTLNSLLGWGKADTDFITGGDNATVILATVDTEAPNSVNLIPINNVIIETSITSKNYLSPTAIKHIGAKVPIQTDRNTFEYFENHDGHRALINSKAPISNIQFFIKDEDDNLLDLNGVDWNCNFVIEELTELHKGIINLPNVKDNVFKNPVSQNPQSFQRQPIRVPGLINIVPNRLPTVQRILRR